MSLKEAATRAAVLSNLAERIGLELKAAKADLQVELKRAKEETGTRQVGAELPDGRAVAKVTLVTPKPAATVTDEDVFLAWVRDNRPEQIERRFVTEVRAAFVKVLLDEMSAAGVAQWCDQETGEVHTVPGVEMQPRAAYHRVTFEKDGKDAIAEAWASGQLTGLVLPELTAGGAE
ncbi:hypothetical protein P3T35_003127 [Kitasatospora sp. GP30]|uniref:hypothetical protein n=1 Tax=Kitasatospora sp. GP30 TaxID=3035084 RepID=UPI000C70372D|nr:hypothetical protein [Kitasatospora sp. GP30]MDH6141114.1 hypothetical protein [Kitasatospora sp. GP30]